MALIAVWRISRKILLICGSITMAQCWLIYYTLMDESTNHQLLLILSILVSVYKFMEVWSYKSI